MIRAILSVPLIALTTVVLGAPVLLTGLVDRTGRLSYRVSRCGGRLVLGIVGVLVNVTGASNVPRGRRSSRSFKRGSFVLALDTGVPVMPVSLRGVKHVVPRGLPTLKPGEVQMIVHPAEPTAGRGAEAADALAEEVWRTVVSGCEEA